MYKPLKSGKYRLIKDIITTQNTYISVEFIIE